MFYITLLLLIAGIVMVFMSNRYASAAAFAGLLCAAFTTGLYPVSSLVFWGVAALIVIALAFMLPKSVSESRRGLGYIAGAALAGAFVGMVIGHAWMIVGSAAGAFLGSVAYSRTPAGKVLQFPSSKFFNYLCAKGLPAVVTIAIAATALMWITLLF